MVDDWSALELEFTKKLKLIFNILIIFAGKV